MHDKLAILCRRLDYTFKDRELIKQALSHCSVGAKNYERLEFLGDSILNFVIAHELFVLFPQRSEGELSRLRASLVKGDCLAEIAAEIDLGKFLYVGPGELKTGSSRRVSMLADALEAVIAAVFLEAGLEQAVKLIKKLYHDRLSQVDLDSQSKDFKTLLQEHLQAKKRSLPVYTLVETVGDGHEQVFRVLCAVIGFGEPTKGAGTTRRKAEQDAAALMLQRIKK